MKMALGKGLSALIPEKNKTAANTNEILDLNIKMIVPNEYQPRKVFNNTALNDLVDHFGYDCFQALSSYNAASA